jgi:hypothetical protein
MALPVRLKLEREETPLAGSAILAAWRIEATLTVGRLAYGLAFAIPVAIRHESPAGSRTQPVLDLLLILREIALAGSVVLIGLLIAKKKGRDDERI